MTILDPEHVKEVLTHHNTFQKKFAAQNPLCKLLLTELGALEGDKYHKHKKIISPAFHLEKLKALDSHSHHKTSLEIHYVSSFDCSGS